MHLVLGVQAADISIHALREEGDGECPTGAASRVISIHALREEGDVGALLTFHAVADFYPRPPRGGRPFYLDLYVLYSTYFYPRPPRGGRRRALGGLYAKYAFLSTPSARRATLQQPAQMTMGDDFYPRPPRGGRLIQSLVFMPCCPFLSTPSARRATRYDLMR